LYGYNREIEPDAAFLKFILKFSHLQKFGIAIGQDPELSSLFQLVFCDARQQGAWQEIREVEVRIIFVEDGDIFMPHHNALLEDVSEPVFNQMVGQQQKYEKWWNQFTVSKMCDAENMKCEVILQASM
jgi:hypothetical protein